MLKKMDCLLFCILLFLSIFEMTSCSDGVSSSENWKIDAKEDSLSGMLRVSANNLTIRLGTDDCLAKSSERPEMKVVLDYDFSIGKTEVTCKDFNALMKPLTGLKLNCSSKKNPATDVTYYDAVLYANERSKADGFDTAYTYIEARFDSDKHCTSLEGFVFHSDVDAYRLPTEAEWTLVAKNYWNLAEGWTADNSDFKLHEVCSKKGKNSAVCDIVGNAMEWVNDWLGYLRDTTVSNYVGAPDGGTLGERIVKGGSYRNAAETIHLYNRGDVYTVTSSTRADYVGFRLAFGSIPNAVWMGNDGSATTSIITPLATSAKVRSLAGTYNAKLVFRNSVTGNIAFVDYLNSILSVNEIVDTIDAFHPEVSPNGKKVAFCTKLEGVSGNSNLYVRDLNVDGTNLVKLDVKSAAIPRWRVLENGDTVIVYVTDAGNNKNESSFKSASTWQVKFSNGKFGKPKKLFDGAYHGGISDDNTLAVSGARLLRARIAKPGSSVTEKAVDTVWYKKSGEAEQACNVSLAKDGGKRTLFLDFGGKTGRKFVGENYGTHERLLIADSSGKLIQSVAAPNGYSFDHTEWAWKRYALDNATKTLKENDLVVASLTNAGGAHSKIVLVNLSDSSVVDLVEGDELWHPCLWIKSDEISNGGDNRTAGMKFESDSAGVYLAGNADAAAGILRYKMELLWTYKDSANVVVLGSSRPLNAVIPQKFDEEFFVLNLANVPNMMVVSDYLATNYVIPHLGNLKYLVISLDIDLWHHNENTEYNFFYQEYKKYPGYVYDANHNFWKNENTEGLALLTNESVGIEFYQQKFMESRGFNSEKSGSWEAKPSVEYDSTWFSSESKNYYASLGYLRNILQAAENRGIYVIGVVFPQSPGFKKTGAFGRYGIRRSEAPKLLNELESLSQKYPHFIFWDENKMGNHDYTDKMAANKDHLCTLGAEKFTQRLDSLLKTLK